MPLRTVFFGTPDYCIPTLKAVYKHSSLVGIVTNPDKISGRGRKKQSPYPAIFARENNIPLFQPEIYKNNPDIVQTISDIEPDIFIIIAYGFILPQTIINIPSNAPLNLHASILPKLRGASPIQTALLNGESITGVTVQRINERMDAGDILLTKEIPVSEDDDYTTLSEKLSDLSAECVKEAIKILEKSAANFTIQDENMATYCRKITKEDGIIDWNDTAANIINKIRAYCRWPVANTMFKGFQLNIHKACLADESGMQDYETDKFKPGTVISADKKGIFVKAADNAVSLVRLQLPGKKILKYTDFINGNKITSGDMLGK